MRIIFCWMILFMAFCLAAQGLASEITIWDNQASATGNSFHTSMDEDQEVEPSAVADSAWDLEGMFYENGILSIVGEWNFIGTLSNIGSGDIFISTTGSAIYGSSITSSSTNTLITNSFGYNYVFDVDWESYSEQYGYGTYYLRKIDETTLLNSTQLGSGNPASYAGGDDEGLIYVGQFTFTQTDEVDYTGTTHYMVSNFDLTQIPGFTDTFIAHFTQECGNDVIMGQVPEPATMLLLGMGLLGISAIGKKLPFKNG